MKLLPKIICTLSIFLCTLFVACDKKEPTLTDTPTQTPTPAEAASPVPTASAAIEYPEVATLTVDSEANKFVIVGRKDYQSLKLPDNVADFLTVEVYDDDFPLYITVSTLQAGGYDVQNDLTAVIDRTEKSINLIKQYITENTNPQFVNRYLKKTITIRIDGRRFDISDYKKEIVLNLNSFVSYREFQYLIALMHSKPIGWEQVGYAWYVGTCINPYNEFTLSPFIVPGLPYYEACIKAGVTPENMAPSDFRTYFDSLALVCFEKGLSGWGSSGESSNVSNEWGFSRIIPKGTESEDEKFSSFTAASFIGWLAEKYGFNNVTMFCFGEKTFEEAFSSDFETEYNAWKEYIIKKFS